MALVDKKCVQQILGCLLKHPQYLSEIDKYNLTLNDFPSRFERYIFGAIQGLYYKGAQRISAFDVENYLSSNDVFLKLFNNENGIEYLQDVEEYSNEENFPYYYKKLKKLNLLNDFKKQGFDISDFYIEDLLDPRSLEINQVFEQLEVQDIVLGMKKKLLKLETEYVKTDEVQSWNAADEIDEIVDNFGNPDEVGLPIQGNIINKVINGAERGALTIRSAPSGVGKALPNSSKLPTPNGWREVGEIKVGDYLFDAFGKPTKVLGVYPQGKKRVYEVEFKDGRSVKCCNEHLWSFNTSGQRNSSILSRKFYTKTLKEIMTMPLKKNGGWDILVPMQKAVEYQERKHFIPPYIMGLFLGDGSFRQNEKNKAFQFSSADEFLPTVIANTMGWRLKRGSENNYTWYFSDNFNGHENVWVEDVLVEHRSLFNTKSETKFIPRVYIEDSIENRYQLLNGLLDSDGSVDEKGRITYYTISPRLAQHVEEICQSLGFKTSILLDTHKSTNDGYILHITGAPEDKLKLFNLPRKKQIIEKWYYSKQRKEKNLNNPIVNILDLGYEEEMTCFYVDNEEHLFLAENFVVTHNTRHAVGDACLLAYPIRYNSVSCEWEQTGRTEKVLFIITEQHKSQILKMIVAYLTDINESKFKFGHFTEEEKLRIEQAKAIMKKFRDNFHIIRIPNPTIDLVKTMVRESCITNDIGYVFYDYIFIGPALLNEFRGFSIRNDEALLMFATALKDLAVELNVSVFTATQVNAKADENREIRNEGTLAGGRSTINKADNGAVMARPTLEELEVVQKLHVIQPNVVTDIFKVRSGEWNQVRIWSYIDLGTMRKQDLFITDSRLEPINDFFDGFDVEAVTSDWEYGVMVEVNQFLAELNNKLKEG